MGRRFSSEVECLSSTNKALEEGKERKGRKGVEEQTRPLASWSTPFSSLPQEHQLGGWTPAQNP